MINMEPAKDAPGPLSLLTGFQLKTFSVPRHNCLWFDDDQGILPVAPQPGKQHPEQTVSIADWRFVAAAFQNDKLLTQGNVI